MMDVGRYKEVAEEVFDVYNKLLPYSFMSPSFHVLLVHVPQMLAYPISRSTEECIEVVHKVFRTAIRRHTNTFDGLHSSSDLDATRVDHIRPSDCIKIQLSN